MDIAGKTFLVAGGSSGLGEACVRKLSQRGASGLIADLRAPHSTAAASFTFCETDVTEEASVGAALAAVQKQFGSLHGAVICAGLLQAQRIIGRSGPADLDTFRRVIEVNLVGTYNVLRLVAAGMRDNQPNEDGERGVIVTTASIAAFDGQAGQTAYAASKGGVAALTLPAARELARYGIRVVCIAPGVFATPMMEQVGEEQRQQLETETPFPRRFGKPDEFAALVEHVLENPMLNGEVIRLDGALRMPWP